MHHNFSDVTTENEAERLGRLYPIILADYNPKYPELHLAERDFLLGIFGDAVFRISHIGSTAVPNLISKPTIDILLEIKKDTNLTAITEKLTNNGYIVNKPPMDIITYIKGYGENGFEGQVYHIHVREFADHDVFYFRDYLLAHPETAKEYGELKQKLLTQFEHNRDGYTAAKSEFVGRITKLGRDEFAGKYMPKNVCDIISVKDKLLDSEILDILKESIYDTSGTGQVVREKAEKYANDKSISAYGIYKNKHAAGIVLLDIANPKQIIIEEIAVSPQMQKQGIGSKLIDFVLGNYNSDLLIAETDNDAVGFYQKCGFDIINLGEKYLNCIRYRCERKF